MKIAVVLKAPCMSDTVTESHVIFADGGYKYKKDMSDKTVLAVVGDFDSLGKAPKNERVVGLEVEKNFTDGERAVRLAKESGASEIVIYGGFGGKIEHVLGNIALLKIAKGLGVSAVIKDVKTRMRLISGTANLKVEKGSTLSLIPYGGECSFISSKGLYYPLDRLTLTPADTRGISNVSTAEDIEIKIEKGESLVIYQEK